MRIVVGREYGDTVAMKGNSRCGELEPFREIDEVEQVWKWEDNLIE